MMDFITKSAKETQDLAAKIIKDLIGKKRQSALILGLVGELGAGKTTFIQGLARALKIKERVLSPTFVIVKSYKLQVTNYKFFYHIDCYRIENPKELLALGFKEIIKDHKNLVVVEWAEKIKKILSKDTVWLEFEHLGGDRRRIKIIKQKTYST